MGGGKAWREIFWEVHMQKGDLTIKRTGTNSKKQKQSKLQQVEECGSLRVTKQQQNPNPAKLLNRWI